MPAAAATAASRRRPGWSIFRAQAFPLVGERVDVIGRNPSPALVYLRRKHVISVIAVPVPDRATMAPQRAHAEGGYNVIQWIDGGVAYWAVSDLNAKELEEFVKLFRAA